jgi:hypothetical protein
MATCLSILYLFLTQTMLTRLGNMWSSVAQILSPETDDITRSAMFTSDREIEKVLENQGRKRKNMRLCLVDSDEEGWEVTLAEMRSHAGRDEKELMERG